MTLPEVCPRDGVSQCKKAGCHLYVIDWRSGDEQCIIGYSSTHRNTSKSSPVVDTYAERTHLRRQSRSEQRPAEASPAREFQETVATRTAPHDSDVSDAGSSVSIISETKSHQEEEATLRHERAKDEFHEMVVSSDKNTTLIESNATPDDSHPVRKKRKSIEDVMDLDLPDNYEEEFWK